jgi:Spy/CpxP family protein refolding chaperone
MKSKSSLALSVTLLTLTLALPVLQAADAPAEPPRRERGPGGPGERLQLMAERLALTAEQKEKVALIFRGQMEAGRAIREDQSLTREQAREKMQANAEASRAKIRALLTPEQQVKFDAMPQRGPGGPGGERPNRN